MKKSTLTFTISLLIFLLPPLIAKSDCYIPYGSRDEWIIGKCSCEDYGFKINYKDDWGDYICMDRNCVVGYNTGRESNDIKCRACAQNFYISGSFCLPCPAGASCDGYTIQCGDGYFNDESTCKKCDPSCQTCSGSKSTQCTSCNSGRYLSNGSCLSCPANAICSGSSTFTCNSGYSNVDGECVKNEQEPTKTNTVNTCPSRMTLSADGCCCVNK